MVKQERAVRTRAALVRAAAEQFDRDGYDGTSLSRISNAATISMGALTFHFSSKADLADAVQEQGRSLTLLAVERVSALSESPLRKVVELTLELTRLLQEDPVVRSTVRLSRERSGLHAWSDIWLPTVGRLLDQAYEYGQLREGARPTDVTTLVEHLTGGAEVYLRGRLGTKEEFVGAVAQLERVWRLALEGVSATGGTALPGADTRDVRVPEPRRTDG